MKNNFGFTLAEMLIVIGILAVLSMAILTQLNPMAQIRKGYDTVKKSDLKKIQTAFEAYYTDHNCYPPTTILSNCGSDALTPYLKEVPCDPDGTPYIEYIPDNDSVTCPQNYSVYATLGNKQDPEGDLVTYCPDIIVKSSSTMAFTDTVKGCSGIDINPRLYGCRSGSCALLFEDTVPTCGTTYDQPDCGGKDCSKKNFRGAYSYECN